MAEALIITGTSGAGKSSVLKILEDIGYLSVDNFPVRLLLSFLNEIDESFEHKKVALGMDIRDKHFLKEFKTSFEECLKKEYIVKILFLDARNDVIIARYNQTRRIHPLVKEGLNLEEAINKERKLLEPIREISHIYLDTSEFNIHQLKNEILKLFGKSLNGKKMVLHILAFGYKYGIPYEANFLFDVRFLPNPYFVPELKPLSGTSPEIKNFLLKFRETEELLKKMEEFLNWIVPFYLRENHYYLTLAVGCTGGKHRSVAIAEIIKNRIEKKFPEVEVVLTLRDAGKE